SVVGEKEAVRPIRPDRVMDEPVPHGVHGFASDAVILELRTDLRQTAHADHEAVDRVANRLPFLRVEEDQRPAGGKRVKESRQQCFLALAAEDPRCGERWLPILRKPVWETIRDLLLVATCHPREWHGEC